MIYTFGHSNHSAELFMKHVLGAKCDILIDVRSRPYSRYTPHFSRPELVKWLKINGVGYTWGGKFLGGLATTSVYSAIFKVKMEQVVEMAEDKNVILMCSEKDPTTCHRAGKLAAWINRNHPAIEVDHILAGGELINSREAEPAIKPKIMWHEYGGTNGKPGAKVNRSAGRKSLQRN